MDGQTDEGGPLFCSLCGSARNGQRCAVCGMLTDPDFPNGSLVRQGDELGEVVADFGDRLLVRGFLDNGAGPFVMTWWKDEKPIVLEE